VIICFYLAQSQTSYCSYRIQTLSSTEKKPQVPAILPPMQMTALPSVTAQRVASLRSSISTSTSSAGALRSSNSPKHVASSLQKSSDASLRSTRNHLPTIAGSPSVGGSQTSKEAKGSPTLLLNSISGGKEAPTKIPRISSRTSATSSPPLKLSTLMSSRRASINVSGTGASSAEPSPVHGEPYPDEFGFMEHSGSPLKTTVTQRTPVRGSPSASTSRAPRQSSTTVTATSSLLPRKSNRDSISFTGIRKSSTGSVASISSILPGEPSHRFSALSPSKGLKLLSPKVSHSVHDKNSHRDHRLRQVASNASRQSSSSSSIPSPIDEDELIGDEEMLQYIRRQQAKKLATGATQAELDDLLSFPEPIPPTPPSTPAGMLASYLLIP
jgi:dual specificity tyrosine-phosphorylation-regulated kinase 2/3/4